MKGRSVLLIAAADVIVVAFRCVRGHVWET